MMNENKYTLVEVLRQNSKYKNVVSYKVEKVAV